MKRILYIITTTIPGGAERQLYYLAKEMLKYGYDVGIISLKGSPREQNFFSEELNIPIFYLEINGIFSIWKACKIFFIVYKFNPQIIHTFMFHANIIGKIVGFIMRKKVITSIRVMEVEKKWHILCEKLTQWMSTKTICVNERVKSYMEKYGGFSTQNTIVINNGIDIKYFSYLPRKKTQPFIILSVGRISRQKGYIFLIEAYNRLNVSFTDIELWIVGREEDFSYAQKVKRLVDPDKKVKFFPETNNIIYFYKKAHVLVLPSLWEGTPNVILEAFSCGLPVIATKIPGVEDIVKDEITGFLCVPASSISLKKKLESVILNYEKAINIAQTARKYVEERFNIEKIGVIYNDLYREV